MKKAAWIAAAALAFGPLGGLVSSPAAMALPVPASPVIQAVGVAQAEAPKVFVPHYYRLVFVVKEVEAGKVLNTRSYFMSIASSNPQQYDNFTRSLRTGARVPVETSSGQFNYMDVGINIDCSRVLERPDSVAMTLSAEVSSFQTQPADPSQATPPSRLPITQQNKWNSEVIVPLGKPTVVFSSDDVNSKRTLQLELTATEIR